MRIALATCDELPDFEVDDRPFVAALAARGVEVAEPSWTDPDVNWSAFDACLIRTTWDYHLRRDDFVAWAHRVEAQCPLFNPASIVAWNSHKAYLRELAVRDVPTIPTRWLDRGAPADPGAILAEEGWTRAFLKPAIGATAHETLPFDASPAGLAEARAHVERLQPTQDLLLQPYFARVEREGECSVILIDGAITHGVRKVPVEGDYRVQDDFGAHDEPWTPEPAAIDAARRALRAIGDPPLYARADFLRDDAGDWCLSELELIEPSLFFRHAPDASERLADAVVARVRVESRP